MSIKIKKNVLLAPLTTFKIGGPARFFIEARNQAELEEALEYARENGLDFFVLGGGSNLLVSDNGFEGMVIKLQIVNCKLQVNKIECGAGANLMTVVKKSAEQGLSGLEWAGGIPGTIGGAVRGNAGAFGGEMSQLVENVKVLEISNWFFKDKKLKPKFQNKNFVLKNFTNKQCQFAYRESIFKKNKNLIILSATLSLRSGNKEEIKKKIQEIISSRAFKQTKKFSAGSFFINPKVDNLELIRRFETEKKTKSRDGKLPAGWLIEEAGLKGKKIGGAQVSNENGNFLINTGRATAEDVIILASLIKQKIRSRFGVQLIEEIQYLGF